MIPTETSIPTTSATACDRFSWRRVWQFGMLYRPAIRVQILIYAALIPAIYLGLVFLPDTLRGGCSILLGTAILISPIVFAYRDNTIIRLAPVKASERMTFYLMWPILIVPVGIELYMWLLSAIGSLISPDGNIYSFIRTFPFSFSGTSQLPASAKLMFMLSAWLISIMIESVILKGAVTLRRHPVLGSLLRGLGMYFLMMLCYMVWGIIVGIKEAIAADNGAPLSEEAVAQSMTHTIPIAMCAIGAISLIITAFTLASMYRRLR